MKNISVDYSNVLNILNEKEIHQKIIQNEYVLEQVLESMSNDTEKVLGWMNIEEVANDALVCTIEQKAKEIREKADVFLLIGVGGSNQGARAVIKAIQKEGTPEILYSGNSLSPKSINEVLGKIKGKSVYANIIAKNFATLEPGICFRAIRQFMEEEYGEEEAGKRIVATGSPGGSSLESLAKDKGYLFLPFPIDVGGRYSVMSSVGLLPIAVSGLDIRELISGVKSMRDTIHITPASDNVAFKYALIRNMLQQQGKVIEILGHFEPSLKYFAKWWVQLFAESEGKDDKGIFPSSCSFSEDLHSLGQYIQSGQKMLFETFLNIEKPCDNYIVKKDISSDNFDYLDGMDFEDINKIAFKASVKAHFDGGIPSLIVNIPELNAFYFGQLFYFFEIACYISGKILGVNPFDQPGVEEYKKNMFSNLK
jgi:glucose-6-phosphate isomerase